MPFRKSPLATGHVYHIFNKSIAGFKIFNTDTDYNRLIQSMLYYNSNKNFCGLTRFKELGNTISFSMQKTAQLVEIIAFCHMPTHFHLILKQLKENGISCFMNALQKSYSQFFNRKQDRKGPLWQGPFKNKLVDKDEYLIHLTRYIHLNPVKARIANTPKDWPYSSFNEYIGKVDKEHKICEYENILNITSSYEQYVNDHIDYQRSLSKINHLIIE